MPRDPLAEAQMLYAAAGELAGPRLASLAELSRRDRINENEFLQPIYRQALEEVAARTRPSPSVSPTLLHGLKRQWPRLGNFDVSLAWGAKATVFGELKCGSDEGALSACGWDAVKCAFCLRHGVGMAMLLVAAAPAELWRARGLGLELLDDAEWDVADIRLRYSRGFRKWEAEGYKPLRVPSRIATSFVARSEFLIAGKLWILGVARVEPLGEEWLDWVPFLPVSTIGGPPGQDEPTDPDLPQDPGIPGPKVEEEQELEREQPPDHGFPGPAREP